MREKHWSDECREANRMGKKARKCDRGVTNAGRSRGEKEGGTDGYTLRAAFMEGDSEANRQDATQSHKRFHISDTHRGHGRVCIVCLDRMQKTLRRQGHRLIQNTRGAPLVLMVSHLCVCLVNKNLGK